MGIPPPVDTLHAIRTCQPAAAGLAASIGSTLLTLLFGGRHGDTIIECTLGVNERTGLYEIDMINPETGAMHTFEVGRPMAAVAQEGVA